VQGIRCSHSRDIGNPTIPEEPVETRVRCSQRHMVGAGSIRLASPLVQSYSSARLPEFGRHEFLGCWTLFSMAAPWAGSTTDRCERLDFSALGTRRSLPRVSVWSSDPAWTMFISRNYIENLGRFWLQRSGEAAPSLSGTGQP